MKNLIKLSVAMVAFVFATIAHADNTANSNATSGANNAVGVQASNGGVNLGFAAADPDATIKNTPGVILGGFSNSFSSDYCGGTAQSGVGGPGFSLALGGPKMDQTCKILRAVEKTANLAQQRMQVDKEQSLKLMHATDIMMCMAVEGVTDVALSEAGINCGSATPKTDSDTVADTSPLGTR